MVNGKSGGKLTKEEALKRLPLLLAATITCSLALTALIQAAITYALGGSV